MDPISAFGLASSIINFIDFGCELVSFARQVRSSATGATTENQHINFLSARIEATATELKVRSTSVTTPDEQRLHDLSEECLTLSQDLRTLVGKIKAKDPKCKRQLVKSFIMDLKKKEEKRNLEERLDKCRDQLHLQLDQTSWFVAPKSFTQSQNTRSVTYLY